MTGGGFGGCTINLVREEHVADFTRRIAERYRQRTGINPDVYLCTAENGAGEVT
jgi:galactokinase